MSTVTLDFETYYDDEVTLKKLTTMEYILHPKFWVNMVGIKIDKNPTQIYIGTEIATALSEIDWGNSVLVCHNTTFDAKILAYHYGHQAGYYADTMSMAHIVHGNVFGTKQGLSLDDVCRRLGIEGKQMSGALVASKGLSIDYDSDPDLIEHLSTYCAADVEATRRIYDILLPKVPLFEMDTVHVMLNMWTKPMFKLNADKAKSVLEDVMAKKEATLAAARPVIEKYMPRIKGIRDAKPTVFIKHPWLEAVVEACGNRVPPELTPDTVLGSSKDFPKLMEAMGLQVPQKLRKPKEIQKSFKTNLTKVEKLKIKLAEAVTEKQLEKVLEKFEAYGIIPEMSTEEAARQMTKRTKNALEKNDEAVKHYLEHPDPEVVAVIKARLAKMSNQEESRLKSLIQYVPEGELFPTPIRYPGTHTLRGAGDEKINMQNLPNAHKSPIRSLFTAPEGMMIAVCDSAQIEPRVAAWLCGEEWMLKTFEDGLDLYSMTYARVMGVPYEKLSKDDPRRQLSKILALQLNYGAGAGRKKKQRFSEYEREHEGGLYTHFILGGQEKTFEETQFFLKRYRDSIPAITGMWKKLEAMGQHMADGGKGRLNHAIVYRSHRARYYDKDKGAWRNGWDGEVILGNGTSYWYRDIRKELVQRDPEDDTSMSYELRYSCWDRTTKSVQRTHLYGGKFLEHFCQNVGTSVVKYQGAKVMRRIGYSPFCLQAHDEWVAMLPEERAEEIVQIIAEEMNRTPTWAPGLPVSCEYKLMKEYA